MLVFRKNHATSALGQISCNEIAYDKIGVLRKPKPFPDPVLDLLWSAGLDNSHLEMLHKLAAITCNLSAGSMRIVATDDEGPAPLPAQAEFVSIIDDVNRVRSNVEPDALHHRDSVNADVKCAVECGCALGLVVRHLGP